MAVKGTGDVTETIKSVMTGLRIKLNVTLVFLLLIRKADQHTFKLSNVSLWYSGERTGLYLETKLSSFT